jgi:protein required for attachment to host cells
MKTMNSVMIVVASHQAARLFRGVIGQKPDDAWEERADLIEPLARAKGSDLTSDAPGRAAGQADASHHALQSRADAKTEVGQRFVRELAAVVNAEFRSGHYARLYVLAEPKVWGALRDKLDSPVLGALRDALPVNVVKCSPTEIRRRLPERL